MRQRHAFRPAGVDALEERLVLSQGVPFGPTGLVKAFKTLFHLDNTKDQTPPLRVGALGDGDTDEYRFGAGDLPQARNWLEILNATHRINSGPFTHARRQGPRGQGFTFNWAQAGATSADMVRDQLPGLTHQVASGRVRYAWISIGGNDFGNFLRNASSTPTTPSQATAALDRIEAQAEANFTTAVRTLLDANPKARLVVATVPDPTLLPQFRGVAASPAAEATRLALARYNALIASTARDNPRVALVDLAAAASQLARAPGGSVDFGGIALDVASPGNDVNHAFLADGLHLGTVAQGMVAEGFIGAVNAKFGAKVHPLAPPQVVQFAGRIRPGTP